MDCARAKCVALTFDDGPTPFTDRLLRILNDNDAKATFFLIGNKVAQDPQGARRIAQAGMEIGGHTWEHPNMTTIPEADIPGQLSKATEAIAAATGQAPTLYRPAGGLSNTAVRTEAARQGLAEILWDVIPFDWINDSNIAATRYMLMNQGQARFGCPVARHLLQHCGSGLPIPTGTQGQRLPDGHRRTSPGKTCTRLQLRRP